MEKHKLPETRRKLRPFWTDYYSATKNDATKLQREWPSRRANKENYI